jgi:hypothetical protein
LSRTSGRASTTARVSLGVTRRTALTMAPKLCGWKSAALRESAVLDPYCGSGTTLLACEQLGRISFGIELDPRYVAVILERLNALGLTPKLIATNDDLAVTDTDNVSPKEEPMSKRRHADGTLRGAHQSSEVSARTIRAGCVEAEVLKLKILGVPTIRPH